MRARRASSTANLNYCPSVPALERGQSLAPLTRLKTRHFCGLRSSHHPSEARQPPPLLMRLIGPPAASRCWSFSVAWHREREGSAGLPGGGLMRCRLQWTIHESQFGCPGCEPCWGEISVREQPSERGASADEVSEEKMAGVSRTSANIHTQLVSAYTMGETQWTQCRGMGNGDWMLAYESDSTSTIGVLNVLTLDCGMIDARHLATISPPLAAWVCLSPDSLLRLFLGRGATSYTVHTTNPAQG